MWKKGFFWILVKLDVGVKWNNFICLLKPPFGKIVPTHSKALIGFCWHLILGWINGHRPNLKLEQIHSRHTVLLFVSVSLFHHETITEPLCLPQVAARTETGIRRRTQAMSRSCSKRKSRFSSLWGLDTTSKKNTKAHPTINQVGGILSSVWQSNLPLLLHVPFCSKLKFSPSCWPFRSLLMGATWKNRL